MRVLTISYHPTTGEVLMYSASYEGINAKEMGDSFTTTLYGIDAYGRTYYNTIESTTMKDYLLKKFDDENATPSQKTMVIDMLAYGAAAQVYFDYNTDELVTADLTQEQLAYATQEIPEAVNIYACTGSGANVTADITVNSKVELMLNCIVPGLAAPEDVKCIIADADGTVIKELSTINLNGIMYYANYDEVGAKQMREVITATFVDGNGNSISKTVKWNVESYVAQTRANAEATAEQIAMVNAMLTYGDAIATYMKVTNQ